MASPPAAVATPTPAAKEIAVAPAVTAAATPTPMPTVVDSTPAPVVPQSTPAEDRKEAQRLLSKHALAEAITVAQRSTLGEPENATGWLLLGAAQMEAGHGRDATASFRSCAKLAKVGPVGECRAFAR